MNTHTNETKSPSQTPQSTNSTPSTSADASGQKNGGEAIHKTSRFIVQWRGPFISFLSYAIIIGLGSIGLIMMISSLIIEVFMRHSSALSFLSLLTGSGFLLAGTLLLVWKFSQALDTFKSFKAS